MPQPPLIQPVPPAFATVGEAPTRVDAEVVAVALATDGDDLVLGPGGAELEDRFGLDVLELLTGLGAKGRPGEVTRLPSAGCRLLVVGVGDGSPDSLRKAGAALGRGTRGCATLASSVSAVGDDTGLEAFVAGLVLGAFDFSLRTGARDAAVSTVTLACSPADADADSALQRAVAVAHAAWQARWLATVPANIKTPAWLAEQAVALCEPAGVRARVWDETRLASAGFGGILGVGAGSASPPRLVQLDYEPRGSGRRTPRVVLVGKGITFDTGGLSIKPGEAMVNMKRDMTGAAVVASVMSALEAVGCAVKVTGLLACAENSIGADAMRPGDVLRHYGGITSEVTNTDAEGRLVMADALAYAVSELEPTMLVDVATLTGGIKVALGLQTGGFFTTHDSVAGTLMAASRASGERLWRMPLAPEYEHLLESGVADLDNGPKAAPALSAALFLQHFTGGRPWLHLDIASVGDVLADRDEWTKGPSGFGVRVLLAWLGSSDPLEGVA